MAKLIYDRLRLEGYSVSFDIDTLETGNFDSELERRIKKCKDFILILSPGIFDCFSEEGYNPKDDWVRLEIACALSSNKNIVPLMLDDFKYPKRLPNDIKDITRRNSIDFNPKHFEAAYEKLKKTFLLSKPHWKTRHKKRVRSFLATVIFLIVAFLFIKVYTDSRFKVKEAEMQAQRADSIRIDKEVELAQMENAVSIIKDSELALIIDSINLAKNIEIARVIDSMNRVKKAEMAHAVDSMNKFRRSELARATDSIKQYMNRQQATKKTTATAVAKKPSKSKK